MIGPIIPLRINKILNEIDFPRHAYNTYVISSKDENHRTRQKWLRDVGCFDGHSFLEVLKATRCNRAKVFQYKLVNRILSTNVYLKLIKVNENDVCTFCEQAPETLAHMYWFCPHIESYINDIKTSFVNEYNIRLNITPMTWFFLKNSTEMEACALVFAKIIIYEARLGGHIPNIQHFKNKLKREIETERNIAKESDKLDTFEKKWAGILDGITHGSG